jgi:hypothetical protein
LFGWASAARADNVCSAPSPPAGEPCTSIEGTYRLKLTPNDSPCVLTKPIEATFTIGKPLGNGRVTFGSRDLVKRLGFKPRRDDTVAASAAIREGVCCIDLRLTETRGSKGNETERRLIVHLARTAAAINTTATERVMPDRGDDCQLDITAQATLVR